jgi:hypothetical protein
MGKRIGREEELEKRTEECGGSSSRGDGSD